MSSRNVEERGEKEEEKLNDEKGEELGEDDVGSGDKSVGEHCEGARSGKHSTEPELAPQASLRASQTSHTSWAAQSSSVPSLNLLALHLYFCSMTRVLVLGNCHVSKRPKVNLSI